MLEMDALRDEHRLLMLLRFDVATTMVAELIEVLFKPTDIVTRAACTPLLRFISDRVGRSPTAVPTSALARYCLAVRVFTLVWQMAVLSGAVGRVLVFDVEGFLNASLPWSSAALFFFFKTDHGRCALVQRLVINSQRIACLHLSDLH